MRTGEKVTQPLAPILTAYPREAVLVEDGLGPREQVLVQAVEVREAAGVRTSSRLARAAAITSGFPL